MIFPVAKGDFNKQVVTTMMVFGKKDKHMDLVDILHKMDKFTWETGWMTFKTEKAEKNGQMDHGMKAALKMVWSMVAVNINMLMGRVMKVQSKEIFIMAKENSPGPTKNHM